MVVITSLVAAILMQPVGVFPFGFERIRPDGSHDVVFVKDAKDKGTTLGKGHFVSQIPRDGGCVFVTNDQLPRIVAYDTSGKLLTEFSKPGFQTVGRPTIDGFGNFVLAEFVGEEESEIWRIPLKGKGPAMMLSVINKGNGDANPAFEMGSGQIWMNMSGTWMFYDLASAQTSRIDVKHLMDGLPNGSKILEVRPSPSIPKQVAVSVLLPGADQLKWVMVWDRQSGLVSRVSPAGANCDTVDWSRDGRYVFFRSEQIDSGRITMQAVKPTGGDLAEIAVIKDAGH